MQISYSQYPNWKANPAPKTPKPEDDSKDVNLYLEDFDYIDGPLEKLMDAINSNQNYKLYLSDINGMVTSATPKWLKTQIKIPKKEYTFSVSRTYKKIFVYI